MVCPVAWMHCLVKWNVKIQHNIMTLCYFIGLSLSRSIKCLHIFHRSHGINYTNLETFNRKYTPTNPYDNLSKYSWFDVCRLSEAWLIFDRQILTNLCTPRNLQPILDINISVISLVKYTCTMSKPKLAFPLSG